MILPRHDRHRAYNDKYGITRQFILNELVHANRILDDDVFKAEDWEYSTTNFSQVLEQFPALILLQS